MRGVLHSMSRFSQTGFTLVELLVVMGIFAVLAGTVTVSLVRPQTSTSVTGSTNELVADIKQQQMKAMMGASGNASTAQAHGIYVQASQYTLFKGSSYSAGDAENLVIPAKSGITLSTTLPSSLAIFARNSGEVNGFTNGANTITVTSTATGQTAQIVLNRLGVITIN